MTRVLAINIAIILRNLESLIAMPILELKEMA
jgi:hypothetical protein